MDYGKIIFEELNQWVYNDENQAGDKLQVIDASDLPTIIHNIVDTINSVNEVEVSYENYHYSDAPYKVVPPPPQLNIT